MSHGDDYHNDGREYIPAYIWSILGLFLILLLLISIFLIYVLIKTKFLHLYIINTRCQSTGTSTSEKAETANVNSSQTWEKKSVKRLNLDMNNSEIKNENESNRSLRRQDSVTTSNYNTLRTPKKSEGSGDVSPKIMKAVMKDMPIIKPEQMSEICKEVLKRRNVVEDATSSLHNIDQLVKEVTPDVKVEIKYASTPELDVYDVVPKAPRNVKTASTAKSDSEDTNEKPSSNKTLNDNPEANCDIYDFPKESNSNAVEDSDIYDSPMSDKMKIQSGYVVPYFPSTNLSVSFKKAEDKTKYAYLSELSSEQSVKNSQSEVKSATSTPEEEYDNPKELRDKTQIYVNANENLYTSSSTVAEK